MKHFSAWVLKRFGWQIINDMPPGLKKYIVAVAPHTSWKDFFLGLLVRSALDLKIYYLGKKELFDGPFGFFFRWTGGKPVDRRQHTGLVDEVAALFRAHNEFAIALAPEGTRKKVTDLKTGFYFMAVKAHVPIIPCLFNYKQKTVHFLPPFYPSADPESDLDRIWHFYSGIEGAKAEYSVNGKRQRQFK